MVEVFKTDVQYEDQAAILLDFLSWHFPAFRINFDLDDCDRILRIEGKNVAPTKIIDLVSSRGHKCEVLI